MTHAHLPLPMSPQVELLQLGPKGDLVVGTAEVRVLSLVNKGTVVQWLDLKAFNQQAVGAQLCCVLRYLSGEPYMAEGGGQGWEEETAVALLLAGHSVPKRSVASLSCVHYQSVLIRTTKGFCAFVYIIAEANRPMTPSYAITTREAREKALTVAPVSRVELWPSWHILGRIRLKLYFMLRGMLDGILSRRSPLSFPFPSGPPGCGPIPLQRRVSGSRNSSGSPGDALWPRCHSP